MSASELIVYRTKDGKTEVQLKAADGSVWLSQGEMAELFGTTVPNVNIHVRNVLEENELPTDSVIKEFLITADDGTGTVQSFARSKYTGSGMDKEKFSWGGKIH